jgi:hypothetical protein
VNARRHSRIWWYRRLRRSYKLHGVLPYSRRLTWDEAGFARRTMTPAAQRSLKPLHGPSAGGLA